MGKVIDLSSEFSVASGTGITIENLIFKEEFTGNGVLTTFQLDGTILNGTFAQGVWDASNIQIGSSKNVTNTSGNKIYDDSIFFVLTRNEISVVSISGTGLVTLSHPPRSIDFNIYYVYRVNTNDDIDGYLRDDIVVKTEADFVDLNERINANSFYRNDGSITDTRTVTANNGNALLYKLYNTTVADFITKSEFQLTHQILRFFITEGDGAGGVIGDLKDFRIDQSQMLVLDNQLEEGLFNGDDYHVNGIAQRGNRWMTDRGYVNLAHVPNILTVDSLSDLPTPVSNVIDVSAFAVLQINTNSLDLGVNKLVNTNPLDIRGLGFGATIITSSHADATIDSTANIALFTCTVVNTGTNTRSIRVNNASAFLFTQNVTIANDIEIGLTAGVDCQGGFSGQMNYVTANPTSNVRFNDVGFFPSGAFNVHVVADGVTFKSFALTNGNYVDFNAGYLVEVENPDDIGLGTIDSINVIGTGKLNRCTPVSSSNFTLASTGTRGCTIDNNGNLIIANVSDRTAVRYVGITSTVDTFFTPTSLNVQAIVWHKGDVYIGDTGTGIIYQHAGFTTTIIDSFASGLLPLAMVFIGDDLVVTHNGTPNEIVIFDGFSSTIKRRFDLSFPAQSNFGLEYDGVNLIITNAGTLTTRVMEGVSDVTQYTIANPGGIPVDNAIAPDGTAVIVNSDTAFVYDHLLTFDHSSSAWKFESNSGMTLPESSDRGGSSFSDPSGIIITITTQNEWVEISGTDMFYSSFSEREKNFLSDETNGEITWTGIRNRGRIFHGEGMITRTGGGATNIFYELAVGIDMGSGYVIQKDSIGTSVLAGNNTFAPLASSAVTRDMNAGYKAKLFIRNVTNIQDVIFSVVKLAIN